MQKYIPFPFYHNDMPFDISFIFEEEKPAGKHGFLKTEGRNFVFEDGTKAAFWGTNFNGAALFPTHEYAEVVAKRLAKVGINLVRFHQLDAEWQTPNIFAFTKGKKVKAGELDEESMERLDYLIYCLKREGIYCYMDMLTYRRFKTEEGIENAVNLPDAAKPYCMYNDRMIELQKDFCKKFWSHKNPYTGLTYCDDPVFVLTEILNECDLFIHHTAIKLEPYKTEFLQKFDKWLVENNINKKAEEFDLYDYKDETLIDFKYELQSKYYTEMKQCLRECGVKIPLAGNNWQSTPSNLKTQLLMDYYDVHPYVFDFDWRENEHKCFHKTVTGCQESFLIRSAYVTHMERPTYVSEWNVIWPNEYRAEVPLYCAAVGRLQGISGFAVHTYAYTATPERMEILGKEVTSPKLGNSAAREGLYSVWNDPARFGLFYHAALITRRGDVSNARNIIHARHNSKSEIDEGIVFNNLEKSAVVFDASDLTPTEPTERIYCDDVLSDTGELYRNWKKNYGYINTHKTKCVYGFLGKNDELDLSGVKINCKTDFATIAMSSLSDNDICSSDNILLTAVGRAQNKDYKCEGDLTLDYGKAPVMIEVIEADIEIDTDVDNLKVWAVSPEGMYVGTVPTTYENGKLKFAIGTQSMSMYYQIIKE